MEKNFIYNDIATRTGGDIYIGVVGPVRTGKSTFIAKFMDNFVIPNINNKLQKQIATDEMPQSSDGKTIMTTQPKFVPANAVKVQFKNKSTAKVRLVDCVGFFVDGANGADDGDKERLVKTPWSEEEIPFRKAAEIGTKKVISDYSTIGILITTDGSFTDISRKNYIDGEEKAVNELKKSGKPFIILLNCTEPYSEKNIELVNQLEEKYDSTVLAVDVSKLNVEKINEIFEKVLLEFPMQSFNVDMPEWIQALPADNKIVKGIIENLKKRSETVNKMRDFSLCSGEFNDENFKNLELLEMKLGEGCCDYKIVPNDNLFYKIISEETNEEINSDLELIKYIKDFSKSKNKFLKIKDALEEAEQNGYGIVMPTINEMNLEEPTLVKKSGKYLVKLKASAPSLHIMKVDVSTEVSPLVGNEKQGKEMIDYMSEKYVESPEGLLETNLFGKSLHDLVSEGLMGKITAIPKDATKKMRRTLSRMVNENRGGIICILL